MLDLLEDDFVVHWVNIRQDPIPPFPAREDILLGAVIDADGRIQDPGSKAYFLRSLVIDPRDEALLNPQATTSLGTVETYRDQGYFAYAQTSAIDVLETLEIGLGAYDAR